MVLCTVTEPSALTGGAGAASVWHQTPTKLEPSLTIITIFVTTMIIIIVIHDYYLDKAV